MSGKKASPSLAQSLLLCTLFVLVQFFSVLFLMIAFSLLHINLHKGLMAGTVLASLTAYLAVIFVGLLISKRPFSVAFRVRSFDPRLLFLTMPFVLGAQVVSIECNAILQQFFPMPEFLVRTFKAISEPNVPTVILVVILAPAGEELIFRGLFLRGFLLNYNPTRALVLSSVLFVLIHLNPYQFVGASAIGVFLSFLSIRSASVVPCIYGHMLFNGCAYLLGDALPFRKLNDDHYLSCLFFLGGLALMILGYKLTRAFLAKDRNAWQPVAA